jgi:hypothetical protein
MPTPVLRSMPSQATVSAAPEAKDWTNRKASAQALRAAQARQLSGRRRFVDPTTCEREYTRAETEFMHAMQEYKQKSGRMFPTWSEVLEVLKSLGYEKTEERGEVPPVPAPEPVTVAAPSGRTRRAVAHAV